ncbi:uncharacterized protein [Amphiura filiformis]|uniref:uncharacterized protein n=1 Tax=Amphiura filiformis TaxID=82378 RepID=UPI003B21F259
MTLTELAFTAGVVVFTLLSLSLKLTNGQPRGTFAPAPVNNVLEGDTAEFTCNVTGRNSEELFWQSYNINTSSGWTKNAQFTGDLFSNSLNQGKYYTSYAFEGATEMLNLRIVNVIINDGLDRFRCVFNNGDQFIIIGTTSKLTVWTKPKIQPTCGILGFIPTVITGNMEYDNIKLTCDLNDGDPLPVLTWYEVTGSEYEVLSISPDGQAQVTYIFNIGAQDHGREFICIATVADTLDKSLSCSIIPYNPMPVITITPDTLVITNKSASSIICINTGAWTNDTTYLWYIDDTLIGNDSDGMHIIQSIMNSTLVIEDSSSLSNNIKITCEGVIPDVPNASANASILVTIEFHDSVSLPNTIIIAAAAAGGSIVIIVIFIIIVCLVRRSRGSSKTHKENSVEASTGVDNSSVKMDVVDHNAGISTGPENGSKLPKAKYLVSVQSTSSNVAPIYATPNKGQKEEIPADAPPYALPDKTKAKTKLKHTQYEDVGLSSVYDDVSGSGENENKSPGGNKEVPNVECLTYADLEISQPAEGNGAKKGDILGKDDMTVYSEVKI